MALATPRRPRSTLGPLPATRVVNHEVEELYDYEVVRTLTECTMFVVRVASPTVVLGGSQSRSILRPELEDRGLRRRRGGGGCVYLQPDDLWIDWWIPRADERWVLDIHHASYLAGEWWWSALSEQGLAPMMHQGRVEDHPEHRVACFSGRGPGELFIDEQKAVGLTQWRVREGFFLSTVMHAAPSLPLLDLLATVPEGLATALNHATWPEAGIDAERIVDDLRTYSRPAALRNLYLLA